MKVPGLAKLKRFLTSAEQWYYGTPERALDEAYQAAQRIKQLEEQYFGGRRITPNSGLSPTSDSYLQAELQKNLRIARMRLTEFKATNRVIDIKKAVPRTTGETTRITSPKEIPDYTSSYTLEASQYSSEVESDSRRGTVILQKLQFVDAMIDRYTPKPSLVQTGPRPPHNSDMSSRTSISTRPNLTANNGNSASVIDSEVSTELTGSSFIPRSILRTANRFKKELEPGFNTEEEVISDFRNSRLRTRMAIKFVLLLIIVPLLTQQLTKNFVFGPIVDRFQNLDRLEISINPEVQEHVFRELEQFEQRLRFQNLVSTNPLSTEVMETQLREKAVELSSAYQWELTEPFKNLLADGVALGAFSLLIATGKQQVAALKAFLDDVIYGLSDSAKAFIIILFTDVFVGFHSPHGWEVIVDGTLHHFGLPVNEAYTNMFIATFPVMLDTVFKYWIFRYLNQISPSAVATYKNMNE